MICKHNTLLRIDPIPPYIQSSYTCPDCGQIFNPPSIQEIEAVKGVPKKITTIAELDAQLADLGKSLIELSTERSTMTFSPRVEVVKPLPKRTMDPDGFPS